MSTSWIAVFAVIEVINIGCVVHLWCQRMSVWRRIGWTPVVLLPAVGCLFYGGMCPFPSVQPEHERAQDTSYAIQAAGSSGI